MHTLPPLDFSPTVTIVDTQKITGENYTCLGQGTAEDGACQALSRHSPKELSFRGSLESA